MRSNNLATKKLIQLVYSYNGKFWRRSPESKLRYTGGETRLVSMDRDKLTYSKLCSLISERVSNLDEFTLKYRLPGTESDTELPLIVVVSDDDVLCMVEEFEAYYGKRSNCSSNNDSSFRIWIYVCNNDDNFDSFSDNIDGYDIAKSHNHKQDNGTSSSSSHSKKGSTGSEKDCLRKLVLKQQLTRSNSRLFESEFGS